MQNNNNNYFNTESSISRAFSSSSYPADGGPRRTNAPSRSLRGAPALGQANRGFDSRLLSRGRSNAAGQMRKLRKTTKYQSPSSSSIMKILVVKNKFINIIDGRKNRNIKQQYVEEFCFTAEGEHSLKVNNK